MSFMNSYCAKRTSFVKKASCSDSQSGKGGKSPRTILQQSKQTQHEFL